MTPLPVVHQLRARSGRGSADAATVLVLSNVPQRPPLYLLIDSLDADDTLCANIFAACVAAYKSSRASLTGGLLAVVRAAGRAVQSSSANAPCGISALVVNDGEAILAQVEPGACWLLRDGKLLRYPQESVWLDANSEESALRLMDGDLRAQTEPELTRIALQPNDRLLLGSTSIARHVGELLIAQAIARDDPTAALHDLVPDLEFTALSIVPSASTAARKREPASAGKPSATNLQPALTESTRSAHESSDDSSARRTSDSGPRIALPLAA